jgi:flagellar basal body P-ring formation protein FlgA
MIRISQLNVIIVVMFTLYAAPSKDRLVINFQDSVMVNDTVIRFGDIACFQSYGYSDQIDKIKDIAVGEAAPAGFSRFVNTNEALFFVSEKGFKELSIKKKTSAAVKVITMSDEKKVGDYEELIKKFFADSVRWNCNDYSIEIRNKDEKWNCLKKPCSVEISGPITRYPKGIVNLRLKAKQNSKSYSVPVVCAVKVIAPVLVARVAISKGTFLTNDNCEIEKKDISHFAYNPLTSYSEMKDLIASRAIARDVIIHDKLTTRFPVIGKDEQVNVMVDKGKIRISIIMRSRQQGAIGDKIWVENELSHKLIKTRVVGKGKVELLEGEKSI